jgi:hypothetical protein
MRADSKKYKKLIAPYETKKEDIGNKNRICLKDGCHKQAIESHIVQCNGMLDVIAEDGRVIQPCGNGFNLHVHSFRSKPIRNALTFKGFCSYHDDIIFKDIEQNRYFDYTKYKNILLLSYRSILFVYREREILLETHKWVLDSKFYLKVNTPIGYAQSVYQSSVNAFEAIKKTKAQFESQLEDFSQEKYVFIVKEIYYIPFCCSQYLALQRLTDNYWNLSERGLFFNIIPIKDSSFVIFGFLEEDQKEFWEFINPLLEMSDKDFLDKILSILLTQGNDWACSPSFYFHQIKPQAKEIIKNMYMDSAYLTPTIEEFKHHYKAPFSLYDYILRKMGD